MKQAGGFENSSFPSSIQPGGVCLFLADSSPAIVNQGSVKRRLAGQDFRIARDERSIDQGRCLKGVTHAFAQHATMRQPVQLIVDLRNEPVQGCVVTAAPSL